MNRINLFIGILLIGIFVCCTNTPNEEHTKPINSIPSGGIVIADTIIYDVIIKNRDTNDYWTEECLQHLNQSKLIDSLFALVYNNQITAYDLFTEETLSIKELKAIEKSDGFSRDAIGKIQFHETWYYNTDLQIFEKDVYSIILGIEDYSSIGEFRGYKPVFKLFLN